MKPSVPRHVLYLISARWPLAHWSWSLPRSQFLLFIWLPSLRDCLFLADNSYEVPIAHSYHRVSVGKYMTRRSRGMAACVLSLAIHHSHLSLTVLLLAAPDSQIPGNITWRLLKLWWTRNCQYLCVDFHTEYDASSLNPILVLCLAWSSNLRILLCCWITACCINMNISFLGEASSLLPLISMLTNICKMQNFTIAAFFLTEFILLLPSNLFQEENTLFGSRLLL